MELQEYWSAVRVLDTIIAEDASNGEAWYVLAFCHTELGKYSNANECLQNVYGSKWIKEDKENKTASNELKGKLTNLKLQGVQDST